MSYFYIISQCFGVSSIFVCGNYYLDNSSDTFNGPGDIHSGYIYDEVTDDCILELQTKISIRNAFEPLFIYAMRPRVICKGTSEEHVKQKKDGVRLCNAEKDLPKVNSSVVFLMHSDWSGL